MISKIKRILLEYTLHKALLILTIAIQMIYLNFVIGWSTSIHALLILITLAILLVGHKVVFEHDISKMRQRLNNGLQIQYFSFHWQNIYSLVASTLGAVLAYFIFKLDYLVALVVSSAIVFVVSGLLNKIRTTSIQHIDFPFYAGVFIGAGTVFQNNSTPFLSVIVGGAMAGFLFAMFKNTLIGLGGRLGTFAFIAYCCVLLFI